MTPSLVLDSFSIKGFRSFVEEQLLRLPSTGMHLIVGENSDTNGSSGAGKSTIAEAIAFALGFCSFSATDLQSWSWLEPKPLQVCLDFHSTNKEGRRIRLRRGKPTNIQIGETGDVHTSAKTVAQLLREAVGVSPEMLKALTYRAQKTPGLFLSMTDSEKKGFLTELLGMDVFEAQADACVKRITQMERELEKLKGVLETVLDFVPSPPTMGALPNIPTKEHEEALLKLETVRGAHAKAHEEAVAASAAATKRATDAEREWSVRHTLAKEILDHPVPTPEDQVRVLSHQLGVVQGSIQKLKSDHTASRRAASASASAAASRYQEQMVLACQVDELKRRFDQEDTKLQALKARKCDRCQRPWEGEALDSALREQAKAVTAAFENAHLATVAAQMAAETKVELETLHAAYVAIEVANPIPKKFTDKEAELQAALATIGADRARKQAEKQASYQQFRREMQQAIYDASLMTPEEDVTREREYQAKNLLAAAEAEVRVRNAEVNAALAAERAVKDAFANDLGSYEAGQAELKKAQKAHDDAKTALDTEEDFLGLVRGFLAYIFDETLARVATLANQRLLKIPNVEGLTIKFLSERETGEGKMRQEIRPVIQKDGHDIPLKAGTSGGMYSAIELAVDLSLADVIAERSGIYPGWLILDESFDGLDAVCKAACFEMLKDASKDRAIFVIDHAAEMKELFSSIIRIRSQDGKSEFV